MFVYFSVFSDIGVKKYYSRLGRVLVTLDRDKLIFECVGTKGSNKKCVHQKFCITMSEWHDKYTQSRPETTLDQIKSDAAAEMVDYV